MSKGPKLNLCQEPIRWWVPVSVQHKSIKVAQMLHLNVTCGGFKLVVNSLQFLTKPWNGLYTVTKTTLGLSKRRQWNSLGPHKLIRIIMQLLSQIISTHRTSKVNHGWPLLLHTTPPTPHCFLAMKTKPSFINWRQQPRVLRILCAFNFPGEHKIICSEYDIIFSFDERKCKSLARLVLALNWFSFSD